MPAMQRAAVPGLYDGAPCEPGTVIASTFRLGALVLRAPDGAVYEAHDLAVDRTVSVKLGWRDRPADLLAEARRCARVRGGFAATVLATGVHASLPYVATEVLGGIGATAWRAQRTRGNDVLSVGRALARGLATAHSARVIVGTLVGNSVRIVGADRVVPASLSMSQVPPDESDDSPTDAFIDDDDFAAWAASDLYQLGAALFRLAESPRQRVALANRSPDALRTDLPPELFDLISELLQPTPSLRLPAAQAAVQLDALWTQHISATRRVGVVIVDSQVARAHDVASLVRRSHAFAEMTLTTSGADALLHARRHGVHAVLVDADLAGELGAERLIPHLVDVAASRGAALRIGVLLDRPDPRLQARLVEAGASDFVLRDADIAPTLQLLLAQAEARVTPRERPRRVSG